MNLFDKDIVDRLRASGVNLHAMADTRWEIACYDCGFVYANILLTPTVNEYFTTHAKCNRDKIKVTLYMGNRVRPVTEDEMIMWWNDR